VAGRNPLLRHSLAAGTIHKRGELFLIFTAYFDEADTHGPAPTVILAAWMGHAYQWRRFKKKLPPIQQLRKFKTFHTVDIKPGALARPNSKWDETSAQATVDDLTNLVRLTKLDGITIALDHQRYMTEYRAPPIPKRMNLDSQYGVCFRACMSHIFDVMAARGNRDKLHVVFERGHPNVTNCERIFNDMKELLLRRGIDLLGSFTIETKATCAPLMVSDLLAGTYSEMRASRKNGVFDDHFVTRVAGPQEHGITFLELQPDGLRLIKDNFEKERQRGMDEWRARKAARKASSVSSGGR
jgi:hypothetical protein